MAVGDPIGIDLCSKSFDASELNDLLIDYSDIVEVIFDSSTQLTSGIKYVIIVRTASEDEFDWIEWGWHLEDTYADGVKTFSPDAGENWTPSPTKDCYFITKAAGVAKDSNSGDVTSVVSFYGDTWTAQTFTASSTYTITSVILKLWKRGAGSTGTVTVSIRKVETAFSPPSSGPDITIVKRLVAATNNKIYYENI